MTRNNSIGSLSIIDNPKQKSWKQLIGIDNETIALIKREAGRLFFPHKKKLKEAINHQSYSDLATLLSIVKENAGHFTIITRHDLEEALSNCSFIRVFTASLLLEKEGPQETMLYLLGHVRYYSFGSKFNKIKVTNL
ncbi:MAG: hypothetical protein M3R17_08230 [Bacteroidota bacterium]|nr:hypothetical protein [Bacteroidota bacterium]